jgi:hypothetical protein
VRYKLQTTKEASELQSDNCGAAKPAHVTAAPIHPLSRVEQAIGNQALGRRLQAKLTIGAPGDAHEQEADLVAEQVMRLPDSEMMSEEPELQRMCTDCGEEATAEPEAQRKSGPGANDEIRRQVNEEDEEEQISRKAANGNGHNVNAAPATRLNDFGSGQPLPASTRAFFEPRFGCDFSGVRIHTDEHAASSAKSINALAYTIGRNIVFAEGNYSLESGPGRKLLAHELTHVTQQKGNLNRAVIQRKITDAELEAEFQKWADDNKEKINKNSSDYPHQLWTFIFKIIGDAQTGGPKPKPTKAADIKKWEEGFEKAELVADWLIKIKKSGSAGESLKAAAESRLNGILDFMRQADLLAPAMSRSGELESGNRKDLYEEILKAPKSATVSDIERITSFFCSSVKTAADCFIIQTLTDGNDHPIKSSLDVAQTKGMVKVLINNYLNSPELIDALAELLMFNPKVRNDISEALMKSELGGSPDLLFKVLKHPFFIEPEYGAVVLKTLQGSLTTEDYEKKRWKDDMPWAYTYKQKYYVDFLIEMAKKQSITIPKPAKMAFPELKNWLEANTENIAKAANATYTKQEEVFEVYRNIGDIFFYHVPHDRNVQPDVSGKISHLQAGIPSKMRFEADCDVFATYAMRFLSSAGFEGIGYLGIYPKGTFKDRAAHVVALIRKNNKYSFINNKEILDIGITETKPDEKRKEAIVQLKEKGLRAGYGVPLPTEIDVFYGDAEPNGKMSAKFFGTDASLKRPDLE